MATAMQNKGTLSVKRMSHASIYSQVATLGSSKQLRVPDSQSHADRCPYVNRYPLSKRLDAENIMAAAVKCTTDAWAKRYST